MQGVSSALIARNESWVRKQANALARKLPSNVEKADLIQVGLIGVAQAALGFQWEGDVDSDEAREAFVRYARLRVKGAMIDELRQMDHLGRAQRRKFKVVQITRERWRALHGADASLADVSSLCGVAVNEIAELDHAAMTAQTETLSEGDDPDARGHVPHPSTPQDEVEARVDTAIVMRRLEKFLAKLPERERQVIDSYFGIGMSHVELADHLNVSPGTVMGLYKLARDRIARHFGQTDHRAVDRCDPAAMAHFDEIVALREAELARTTDLGPWGEMVEDALTMSDEQRRTKVGASRIVVDATTRWG